MIRKSSAGDACEPVRFKSSYHDGPDGNSCAGIARAPRAVHVRDSKDVAAPRLALTPDVRVVFGAYASDR
ncbi:DUF397 domain-containing protein [Streptomyces sp. NEAU-W12]|uniref:DUF397 domain-containing protein n=1 Tax=Streptomyces sp. NEAU-W12 TaxID=2994668 RepID=UPI00224B0149|nr:DUF397 domain-containing protein [Streptomyces sp. NEAU-W12]MCX2926450.1 DUF397 domain-containing protein [Streptomyces sp. NEAU-W12]